MWWFLSVAQAQPVPHAFVGATLHPVAQAPIEAGVIVTSQGRITAIGAADQVAIPQGAQIVDVSGKVILPGLVDTHSHIGGGGLNERSGPSQPQVSAVDSLDATHVSVQLAQAGGLTTVNVMPGSGNLIGGQTAYVKLRDVATVDEMLICTDRRAQICGGLKMANGTNPQGPGAYPRTRMGAAAQQRQQLLSAREAAKEPEAGAQQPRKGRRRGRAGGDEVSDEPPVTDLGQLALSQVLSGERTVHFHTHRADDIVTILQLQQELGIEVVLHHVSEAWKVADRIAASGVSASLILIDSPGGKEEAVEFRAENARILEDLGVHVSLHTDDPITDSRLFLRSAGLAVRAGMSEAGAIRALTLSGAEQLGLAERIGSLEVGKDADLVVLSGPPLSVYTQVEQTWVDGIRVFDRSDPVDARYATGGYAVPGRLP